MPDSFVNFLACSVTNAPGTAGNVVVGAGVTLGGQACRTFRAVDDGKSFTITFRQDADTEIRSGCIYTHATRTLTRGAFVDSSTGSALNLTSAATATMALSADQAGGLTVLGLTTGSPAAASANGAVLQALADSLAGINTSRLNLVFPDGDVYNNMVINWRCYPRQAVNSNSVVEAVWPEFSSAGTTTFIWTGGATNGAHWTFQHSASGMESSGLRFKNLRWAGPGLSVASTAVATSAVGNSATSITVANGAIFVAGDAIAISADPLAGGSILPTSMPHWATVQSVAGNVVNFLPATPPANFVASVGNRVQRWKQTRAIELGGQTNTRQDVFMHVNFDRCAFIDYFSGVATQDVTGISFDSHCRWAFCKFGVELGFNNDSLRMRFPWMQCQRVGLSGTVSSGQRTITGIGGTNNWKVGMTLADLTAPATAQAFPEWAVIESIDSASQVTMTHPSAVTGSRSFQPQLGWLVALGSGNSPWYPRELGGVDGARTNIDQTVIESPLMSMGNGLVIADGASNSNIEFHNIYIELTARLLFVGNQAGTSSLGPYVLHSGQVKAPGACMGPPIEICGGGANVEVRRTFSDSGLAFPFVFMRGSSTRHAILWQQNNLSTTSSGGLIRPDTYYWNGITPPTSEICTIDIRGAQPSGLVLSAAFSGGTYLIETAGLDGVSATMSASTTFADAPNWAPVLGRRFRVTVVSSAAATLTMGSTYRRSDRVTQIANVVASAAGQVCIMDFIGTGSLWVLVGGTISAGAPVFA